MTLPNSSTEPPAFVVTDAALTLPPNLVSAVLLTMTSANAFVKPKALVKVTAPEPVSTVKFLTALLVAVSITSSKTTVPPSVVRTALVPRVIALPKRCAPAVVTEPPLSNVVPEPLTVNAASALNEPTAPPKVVVPLPVTVKARAIPLSLSTVWFRAISVPARTESLRTKISPLYVCMPVVVILPASTTVEPVVTTDAAVKAAPKDASPALTVTSPSSPVVVCAPLTPA